MSLFSLFGRECHLYSHRFGQGEGPGLGTLPNSETGLRAPRGARLRYPTSIASLVYNAVYASLVYNAVYASLGGVCTGYSLPGWGMYGV